MPLGTHQAQQEREARGFRWFWSMQPIMAVVTAPPEYPRIVIAQEIPAHPRSFFFPGIAPSIIQLSFASRMVTTQEQPSHPVPAPFMRASVLPIPVVPEEHAFGYIL